jgi:hypothetical protein
MNFSRLEKALLNIIEYEPYLRTDLFSELRKRHYLKKLDKRKSAKEIRIAINHLKEMEIISEKYGYVIFNIKTKQL